MSKRGYKKNNPKIEKIVKYIEKLPMLSDLKVEKYADEIYDTYKDLKDSGEYTAQVMADKIQNILDR